MIVSNQKSYLNRVIYLQIFSPPFPRMRNSDLETENATAHVFIRDYIWAFTDHHLLQSLHRADLSDRY